MIKITSRSLQPLFHHYQNQHLHLQLQPHGPLPHRSRPHNKDHVHYSPLHSDWVVCWRRRSYHFRSLRNHLLVKNGQLVHYFLGRLQKSFEHFDSGQKLWLKVQLKMKDCFVGVEMIGREIQSLGLHSQSWNDRECGPGGDCCCWWKKIRMSLLEHLRSLGEYAAEISDMIKISLKF